MEGGSGADGAEYVVSGADVTPASPLIFSLGTREAGFTVDRVVFSTVPDLTDPRLDATPNSGEQVAAPQLVKAVGSTALNMVVMSFSRPLAPASVVTDSFAFAPALGVTGVYEFFVNNDDEAELLMSPDLSGASLQSFSQFVLKAPPFSDLGFTTSVDALTAEGTSYSGTGAGDSSTAKGILLQGYIHNNNAPEPIQLGFNGIPAGTYHLLVYCVGFQFQATYEQSFELDGATVYPAFHVQSQTGLDYNRSPALVRMSSTDTNDRQSGNYVQFENVSPATDGSTGLLVFNESPNPIAGLGSIDAPTTATRGYYRLRQAD